MLRAALVLVMLASSAHAAEWSLIVSGYWLEKTGEDEFEGQLGQAEADFDFEVGGAVGGGVLWRFSDRWAAEAKAAFGRMDVTVRTRISDAIAILELGELDVVPVTLVLQYRPDFGGRWDPYVGIGAAHFFFGDLDIPGGGGDVVRLDDDTGLVLAGGLDVELSERWLLNFDLKYIPFETGTEGATIAGGSGEIAFEPILGSAGVRYRF